MAGWIKLHRKMTEWEWYTDQKVCRLFFHLLITVNHKDSRYQGHDVPRGSRVSGWPKLSEETGLSAQELRTASEKLKSTGEITVKSTNKFSIITLCNFDKYQDGESGNQQAKQHAEQQTSNKRATTSKEVKKERSIKPTCAIDEKFELFWSSYPKKKRVAKVKAMSSWKTKGCGNGIFDQVMSALELQKKTSQWNKDDGQYIPNPTTWINQERWTDEVEVEDKGVKVGGFTF